METARRLLLAILLFSLSGTLAELYLLEHHEDYWQWIPLVQLIGALPLTLFVLVRPRRGVLRLYRLWMLLMLVGGGVGVWLHYSGNVEFELEMYPDRRGSELILESLKGATPALAPASLVQLGLLGLLACFRHPRAGGELTRRAP